MNNTIPRVERTYQRAIREDNEEAARNEIQRVMKKNRNGNYGIFADKCGTCNDGVPNTFGKIDASAVHESEDQSMDSTKQEFWTKK